MKLWIARDKDGQLFVYFVKPERDMSSWMLVGDSICKGLSYDDPCGKDLTWEDDPRPVELAPEGTMERLAKLVLEFKL